MKTSTMTLAAVVSLAGAAMLGTGCDNTHLLGGFDGGPPPSDDSGPPPGGDSGLPPGGDASVDVPEAGGLGPIQSWTGYIENYHFASGSDAVRFSFVSDSAGKIVGTVKLGDGTPPPPATDPNVGYPSDVGSLDSLSVPTTYVSEGYAYTMRDVTLSARRMQFSVAYWELWQGWCALQTPVPPVGVCDEPVCAGSCLPNTGSMISGDHMHCALWNSSTDQYDQPVDCGKLVLCQLSMACTCGLTTCSVREQGIQLSFDLAVTSDGASADGSVAGHNVHFTKDP
jgi:hypothetical protein